MQVTNKASAGYHRTKYIIDGMCGLHLRSDTLKKARCTSEGIFVVYLAVRMHRAQVVILTAKPRAATRVTLPFRPKHNLRGGELARATRRKLFLSSFTPIDHEFCLDNAETRLARRGKGERRKTTSTLVVVFILVLSVVLDVPLLPPGGFLNRRHFQTTSHAIEAILSLGSDASSALAQAPDGQKRTHGELASVIHPGLKTSK